MTKLLYSSSFQPMRPINLDATLFSGQSFNWNKLQSTSNCYSGLIDSTILILKQFESGVIRIESSSENLNGMSIESFFNRYFSLDIDTEDVFMLSFKENYPGLWNQIIPYLSVKVLRQDPFETVVTFMCAQGIGMHLIRRQISLITQHYGEKIIIAQPTGDLVFYRFPSPSALASADVNALSQCTNNNRIRATNIITMARSVESGELNLSCVATGDCPLESLRETLCRMRGIGMKIADCIALFGLGRFDAFPIDTHVKQYLWEWFGIEAARHTLTEKNYRFLQDEARAILGNDFAGYAGHILFHCWRKEIRKMKTY